MMTREDILRELELLPVWQLRTPLPDLAVNSSQTLAAPEVLATVVSTAEVLASAALPTQTFTRILSEDGQWIFVLDSQPLTDDEAQLLRNIFRAMRIQTKPAETFLHTKESIAAMQPACIVTMGEAAAQAMLNTNEPLENLRGKLHISAGVKLAPTYDVKYLLQRLPSKAKAWHDLCIAMQALQETNT